MQSTNGKVHTHVILPSAKFHVGDLARRDRRKLTFYFIAEKRIDFRELVRELFKVYKTRIWMHVLLFSLKPFFFESFTDIWA